MKRRTVLYLGAGLPAVSGNLNAQRRGGYSARADEMPFARDASEKKILDVLSEALHSGDVYLEVPVSDGRMLRLLTEAAGAATVVEIGTSTGFSGLWFCLALQKTGGKLTTFEMDPGRAALARKHFTQAGVSPMVTLVEGDAHANLRQVKGPVDIVFIDADKPGYPDYLRQTLPLVKPGGLILAHNFGSSPEYDRAVTTNPALETLVPAGSLGITLKKR